MFETVLLAVHLCTLAANRVTLGERVHYTFAHRECARGAFTQSVVSGSQSILSFLDSAPSAYDQQLVRPDGLGASCRGGRNGVVLNASCCCAAGTASCPPSIQPWAPVYTQPAQEANLGYAMADGLTIELWLRPAVRPTRRVIASFGARNPSRPPVCTQSGPSPSAQVFSQDASLVLLQDMQGCLEVQVALPAEGSCLRLPAVPGYCSIPGFPRLDDSAMHHVAVTFARNLRETPRVSEPPRFAIYIDGVRVIDADNPPNVGSANNIAYTADFGSLWAQFALNTHGTAEYQPEVLWDPKHILRLGTDGYVVGDRASSDGPWEGELAMLSMYGRPLSEAEVALNYAASLDNSAPLASSANVSLLEDECYELPRLELLASDADNEAPLNRGQALTYRVDPASLARGTLYSNAACSTPLAAGEQTYSPPLFFRGGADEHSVGSEAYAELRWSVSDSAPTFNGSATAEIRLHVAPVNDAPVPADVSYSAYLGLSTLMLANGTDVDGEDPARPIALATLFLASQPSFGEVRSVLGDGTAGPPLAVGDWVPGVTVFYRSTHDFGDLSGRTVVATDQFRFGLRDTGGAVSTDTARFLITLLSGLDAIGRDSTVREEEPTIIELRGINQRGVEPGLLFPRTTAFEITALPANGTLWQYDPLGFGGKGEPMNVTGSVLRNSNRVCADDVAFLCPRLVYEGARDFFSVPTRTRTGAPLNTSDDAFRFTVSSGGETSAEATQTVRVLNVNDPPVLSAPGNVSYMPNMANFVTRSVNVSDPDRGTGVYRVEFKLLGLGGVTQASHKQQASADLSWSSWQYSVRGVEQMLGYCPTACAEGYACVETCTEGNGFNDHTLRFFASADALPSILASLDYRSEAFAKADDGLALRISLEDFDDGVGVGPSLTVHRTSVTMDLFFSTAACTSLVTESCTLVAGSSSGIISWALSGVMLIGLVVLFFRIRRRQRGRVTEFDAAGRARPPEVRGRDMRIWLPLWSILGLAVHLLIFVGRCAFSPYQLLRMDIWGDGFCGANATSFPRQNQGCRSGYPSGFMVEISLGDVLVLGIAGPMIALELDGRPGCRKRCILWAVCWFVLGVIKFGLYRTWEKGIPDAPWAYYDEFALSLGEEVRPGNGWGHLCRAGRVGRRAGELSFFSSAHRVQNASYLHPPPPPHRGFFPSASFVQDRITSPPSPLRTTWLHPRPPHSSIRIRCGRCKTQW